MEEKLHKGQVKDALGLLEKAVAFCKKQPVAMMEIQ
jgi:hypothetical protein